jgi:hypothetical protein
VLLTSCILIIIIISSFPSRIRRYVELPSLEEIEEMDKQRSKAIESLEISDDGGHVKCQGCGNLQPIIKDNTKLITTANSENLQATD